MTNFNTIQSGTTDTFSETNIDFNEYEVLVAIGNSNSITTIDITNVFESESEITVTVQNLVIGIAGDVANLYHIVKIPKSDKQLCLVE